MFSIILDLWYGILAAMALFTTVNFVYVIRDFLTARKNKKLTFKECCVYGVKLTVNVALMNIAVFILIIITLI